jgi:hypothetical protein
MNGFIFVFYRAVLPISQADFERFFIFLCHPPQCAKRQNEKLVLGVPKTPFVPPFLAFTMARFP